MSTTQRTFADTMSAILKSSPLLLLSAMAASFLLAAIFETIFLATHSLKLVVGAGAVSWILAALGAIMVQVIRLALGIAGAADFAKGKVLAGMTGILFSAAVSAWECYEFNMAATEWGLQDDQIFALNFFLQLVVISGLVLEIRLALNLNLSDTDKAPKTNARPQQARAQRKQKYQNGRGPAAVDVDYVDLGNG